SAVADALPLTVATPNNASQNAGTPSTSLGWRLSQTYTADTPQAYARRRGSSSSPKLTGRPPEGGGQDSTRCSAGATSARLPTGWLIPPPARASAAAARSGSG